VPVDYHASNSEIDALVQNLNGFFFPGGGSSYPSSAAYLYKKVIESNKNANFLPLWGTCMGFQWLLISQSGDGNILDPDQGVLDSYNYSIPLDFTTAASSSRLFSKASTFIMETLAKENVTMNNHHYGIYPEHFANTASLSSFFSVLSTNQDRQGVSFVSTIEAFDYPIYGTQWHPEKNTFEWGKTNGIPNEAINHSPSAIAVAQYTADFFVQQARKSSHRYDDADEEDEALISKCLSMLRYTHR
jgi:gamma-glutamyl hydrolase